MKYWYRPRFCLRMFLYRNEIEMGGSGKEGMSQRFRVHREKEQISQQKTDRFYIVLVLRFYAS